MKGLKFTTIDEYIQLQSPAVKPLLEKLRATIQKAAPKAIEVISYNMPAFKQYGVLVYFAAANKHIGFYPTSKPIEVFKDKLTAYKHSKGAIQLPLDKPLPVKLITEIVKFRVKQDAEKATAK